MSRLSKAAAAAVLTLVLAGGLAAPANAATTTTTTVFGPLSINATNATATTSATVKATNTDQANAYETSIGSEQTVLEPNGVQSASVTVAQCATAEVEVTYMVPTQGDTFRSTTVEVKGYCPPAVVTPVSKFTLNGSTLRLSAPEGVSRWAFVYKLDGQKARVGTHNLRVGTHNLQLWVNGKLVDTDTLVVTPVSKFTLNGSTLRLSAPEGVSRWAFVYKLDGQKARVGTHNLRVGTHNLQLWVNGKLVDTDTLVVKRWRW